MKYAIYVPADQTICYLIRDDGHPSQWAMTTVHAEATLWDNRAEALAAVTACGTSVWRGEVLPNAYLEEVPDVAEFQARKDTW